MPLVIGHLKNFIYYKYCLIGNRLFRALVSYNRFIELKPWAMMLLCCFLHTRKGEITGISFIDSTPIEVCHPSRSRSHRVFEGLVGNEYIYIKEALLR